jgi:leucyl aminopeptidase
MQIKVHNNAKKGSGATLVKLLEKGVERLVQNGTHEVLEIPIGKFSKVSPRTLRTLIRTLVQNAKKQKLKKIILELEYAAFPGCAAYGESWFWSTVAENLLLADYEYTVYKSKKKRETTSEVHLVTKDGRAEDGVSRGRIVGEYANMCRDIANTPGGDMTPAILGMKAKDILKGTKARVTVLDEKKIRILKMGGLLGVGQGAQEKPKFIIIEYFGASKKEKPIVFVGKGITFDTGGLQVKPGMAMYEMHMDMSGGAAVIAAIGAIAQLGIKKNVVGLIPAAENAISDKAIRPGDVLTMMSGLTVDVLHTDAEGRLVLADALHYARKYDPSLIVDIATLTGAASVAVGLHAHVIMTKNRQLEDRFRELGEESGDYTFPLPLWDEYKQYTKGVHGDISNIPAGDSKYAGSINGGMFLSHFTKGMKWVHIDMAPRMTSIQSDKLAKGATGEPTRLLVKIAETWQGKAA